MQATQLICPHCNDTVDRLVYRFHYDSERFVIGKIMEQHPQWTEQDGLCGRCVDYYHTSIVMDQLVLPETGPLFPVKTVDDFIVLPTGLRINADPRFTGEGVTICFIDSGFYPHPDLTSTRNRIKASIDITDNTNPKLVGEGREETSSSLWHGTMTSVVCAGDGYLSQGLYKGIAYNAELVFLKVQDEHGRITTENLTKALVWVLHHHKEYNIRIVNMSMGDDLPVPNGESKVDLLAEQLIKEGIIIVADVASAMNVISVEPGLIAQVIWIAAPILPQTNEHEEASTLFELLGLPINAEPVIQRIAEAKYISPDYMHVDGTSFAAPIVSAVIAQLLEANPLLTPAMIREILFSSAKPIQPREALLKI